MLCGGLSRAGSYKVGTRAHHPKVALVRKSCQGTKDTRCMEAHIIVLAVINFSENTILRRNFAKEICLMKLLNIGS